MTKKFKKHSPKKNPKDKPLGAQLIEKAEENSPGEAPVQEIIDQAHQDYEEQLIECIKNGTKAYPNRDFFVTILQKTERLFADVNRFFFIPRLSCPTPTYDQVVYKYHHEPEMLEFLWVIPDREIAEAFRDDPLAVPDEEKDLRQFVLDFYDGTLDRRMKILNNEKELEQRVAIRLDDVH